MEKNGSHDAGELVYLNQTKEDESSTTKTVFPCNYCDKVFPGRKRMERHMRTHTGEKPFQCEVCLGMYSQRSSLYRHIRVVHRIDDIPGMKVSLPPTPIVEEKSPESSKRKERVNFKCETCSKKFSTKSNLLRHMKGNYECGKFCIQCGAAILDLKDLNNFNEFGKKCKVCRDPTFLFKCKICSKSYSTSSSLHRHEKVHGEENEFPCELCDRSFPKRLGLVSHMKKHLNENKIQIPTAKFQVNEFQFQTKKFQCTQCDRDFPNRLGLVSHMRRHKKFPCRQCTRSFPDRLRLAAHMKKHLIYATGTDNEFHCKICPKSFSKILSLYGHMKIHSTCYQAKKYPKVRLHCKICKIQFSKALNLRVHMRIHSSKGKFKCNFCTKEFDEYLSLRGHLKQHSHKDTPSLSISTNNFLKCKICKKAFYSAERLHGHMKTHSGQFSCRFCNKVFDQYLSLRGHLRQHSELLKPSTDAAFNSVTSSKKKIFKCEYCSKVFSECRRLRGHLKIHSDLIQVKRRRQKRKFNKNPAKDVADFSDPPTKKDPLTKEIVKSEYCGNLFSESGLRGDLKMHTSSDGFYNCKFCPKVFITERSLQGHMQIHSAEKQFKCELCPKKFFHCKHLEVHMNQRHIKQSKLLYMKEEQEEESVLTKLESTIDMKSEASCYQCKMCNKLFTRRNNFRQHLLIHESEKRFKCVECEKTFTRNTHLRKHMEVHINQKPFECIDCGCRFVQMDDLLSHMETHE